MRRRRMFGAQAFEFAHGGIAIGNGNREGDKAALADIDFRADGKGEGVSGQGFGVTGNNREC